MSLRSRGWVVRARVDRKTRSVLGIETVGIENLALLVTTHLEHPLTLLPRGCSAGTALGTIIDHQPESKANLKTSLHCKPHRATGRRPICLLLGLFLFGAGVGCSPSDDRPTEDAWKAEWEQRQELIPDAEAILSGGREYCDQLDGEFRVSLRELLPSPSEVLDDPLDEWISHAVSIVFECSQDASTIVDQLETLDVLAAEVDGGLSVER